MRNPVLLVETDDERRSAHRAALEGAGYPVVEARTGEEAIRSVFREHPCAVVIECSVPGVSGLRAAEVLKAEPQLRDTPVILLASDGCAQEERNAWAAQCDAYVSAPRDPESVLEAVHSLTRSARPGEAADRSASEVRWIDERMRETWGSLRRA